MLGLGLGIEYINYGGVGISLSENTVPPSITGNVVGTNLVINVGTWTNTPTGYTVSVYRGITLVTTIPVTPPSTSTNYLLVQADAGNTSNMSVTVTATNGAGTSAPISSNTIAQIFDSNANALLTAITGAGGTYSNTERDATNTLYISLKSTSIYSKLPAFYIFIGGTYTSCKFNGANPVDSNPAYRLIQSGTVTYGSVGATGNGVNGMLDMNYVINSGDKNVKGASVYLTSSGCNAGCVIGNLEPTNGLFALFPTAGGGNAFFYGNDRNDIARPSTAIKKFLTAFRISSTQVRMRANGVDLGANPINSNVSATISTSTVKVFSGGYTNQPSNASVGFACIHLNLTVADDNNLNTIVTAFNTALGRN